MAPTAYPPEKIRLLSLLGVLTLALAIWFLGPRLVLAGSDFLSGAGARLATISLLFAGWLLSIGVGYWNSRRQDRPRIAPPAASVGPAEQKLFLLETEREIATLRRHYEEVIEILGTSQGAKKGDRHLLLQLPWYLIIGPPGTGKTAAIRHSGLEMPVPEPFGESAGKGMGGTRNGDWWFTEDAVMLDTAGRYVTQDAKVVDSAAWFGLLALLRGLRPQRPVNGAILALSIPDLLQPEEGARQELAKRLRKRINELYQHLGGRFPLYVLLTKADLLPGFVEFFEDLDQDQRREVWGMTFALNPEHPAAGLNDFAQEFGRLLRTIKQRSLDRLQQEREVHKRGLIYGFPAAVAALGEPLRAFLTLVFLPSRFEPEFLFRGVYLVSGTQEGTPLDQPAAKLAADVGVSRKGLSAFSGKGKSYFLTRLFREVIFPEAGLAGTDPGQERLQSRRRLAVLTAMGALTAVFVCGLVLSFSQQRQYLTALDGGLRHFEQAVNEVVAAPTTEIAALLPVLNAAREVSTRSNQPLEPASWLPAVRLLQLEGLAARAGGLYPDVLRKVFFPRILHRLEEQLRVNVEHPEAAYEALKLYGMLGGTGEWATTGR